MMTFCISTYNNLNYLTIAISSIRKNSYFKEVPFIIHAENCNDGTNEWLKENKEKYNLTLLIEPNNQTVRGIGGGMNICAENVNTEYIMFLHSDFYVTENWDKALLDVFKKYPNDKMWVNSWRVEPNMFASSETTFGNIIVPKETFGEFYYNFNHDYFDYWVEEFIKNNDIEIPRGLGVSGLIKKKDWDEIGGNDPIFAPTSWDDHDLFLRMFKANFKFITTTKSVIYHFGARGSHRLEENNNKSSERQSLAEQKNAQKFYNKWKGLPVFDYYGQIIGVK
jgi:GT2 family glycosyltransferase